MVAEKIQKEHKRIKDNIDAFRQYFRPNYVRYSEFFKFVCDTNLSDTEKSTLDAINKPPLEFNFLEAYISRLRGEFSKQEPSIEIFPDYDTPIDLDTLKILEGHFKHILYEANKESFEYRIYTDLLIGGFSAIKMIIDYPHNRAFNQVIKMERCFDPTLVGFDVMANSTHKGDGQFSFELFPYTLERFKRDYPHVKIDDIRYQRNLSGYNWAYRNSKERFILVAEYFEKVHKRSRIVQLANGQVMAKDEYNDLLKMWEEAGMIPQPPQIINSRMTDVESIERYVLIENEIIEHETTNYSMLPHIFVDGNSVLIRDNVDASVSQLTRPYVYHARGIQKLKNFAGQTLANELENLIQSKIMIAEEALPENEDYLKAYTNPQIASVFVHKAFKDENPDMPIPTPSAVPRVPAPPEIMNTFAVSDQTVQTILGSYDASLGINDNQLSGVAIVEGATQSNSAAMPYVVGFLQGLNRSCQWAVNHLPKICQTPRTIPIVQMDGKKGYVRVNDHGTPRLEYSDNALQVRVDPGVNFSVQKNKALQQIIGLSQAMPIFSQFMNTKGLLVLLDNLEIKGVDQLKVMAEEFSKEMQQQAAMQAQMAEQNNPLKLKAQNDEKKIMLEAHKQEAEMAAQAAKVGIDQQRADTERLEVMLKAGDAHADRLIQKEKHDTENYHSATELAIKAASEHVKHATELKKLEHEILRHTGE
jgi:hypothetical protein